MTDQTDAALMIAAEIKRLFSSRLAGIDDGVLAECIRPRLDQAVADAMINAARDAAPHHNARNDPEDPASAEFWKARVGEYAVALGEQQKAMEDAEDLANSALREQAATLAAVIISERGGLEEMNGDPVPLEIRLKPGALEEARRASLNYRADASGVTLSVHFPEERNDDATA